MSPRTLSDAGRSLSDIYETVGQGTGGSELVDTEIALVHEMGGLIASERMRAAIRHGVIAAQASSSAFEIVVTDLPGGPSRLLSWVVYTAASAAAEWLDLTLSFRDPSAGAVREMPFWVWDSAAGGTLVRSRFTGDNLLSDYQLFVPDAATAAQFPQRSITRMPGILPLRDAGCTEVVLRGNSGVYAGTRAIVFDILLLFPAALGPNRGDYGVTYPSW